VKTLIDHDLNAFDTNGNVADHGMVKENVPIEPIVRRSHELLHEMVEPFRSPANVARCCQSIQDDVVNCNACIKASIGQAYKQLHSCVDIVCLNEGKGHRRGRLWIKQVTNVLHVDDQLLGSLRHSDDGKELYGDVVGLVVERDSSTFCFTEPKFSSLGVATVLASQKHRTDDVQIRLESLQDIEEEVLCTIDSTRSCKIIDGGADF